MYCSPACPASVQLDPSRFGGKAIALHLFAMELRKIVLIVDVPGNIWAAIHQERVNSNCWHRLWLLIWYLFSLQALLATAVEDGRYCFMRVLVTAVSLSHISIESFQQRHERALTEERKKFTIFLKFPHSTRSRANRRTDSEVDSCVAKTPEPMSPACAARGAAKARTQVTPLVRALWFWW